jgi:hypothetical protein
MTVDPDPDAMYAVVPMEATVTRAMVHVRLMHGARLADIPSGLREGWTVTSNSIPVRHFSDRAKAERYATDPAWRAEIRAAEARRRSIGY